MQVQLKSECTAYKFLLNSEINCLPCHNRYDIKAKIWNSFSSEPMYWSSVEVAIMNMNNEIYCSHGFNAYKIDLNTETVTGTSSLHHGRIIQIISYNDELYFATTEHIYDPALPQVNTYTLKEK